MGIFKRPKELHQASAALYIAIIAALHHIVLWYKEKAISTCPLRLHYNEQTDRRPETLFKSIFKQELYAKNLDELLQDLRKQADRFQRAVSLCSYERIMGTSLAVKAQGIQQSENHKVVVDSLDTSINELRSFKSEFRTHAGVMQGEFREIMKTEFAEFLTNVLAVFLSSGPRMDLRTQDRKSRPIHCREPKNLSNSYQ